MRHALLVALVVATAACGTYRLPGLASGSGVVTGRVLAVPCAPVESGGSQCAGRPVSGLEIDYTQGDMTAKAVTDWTGTYSAHLAAGTWQVRLQKNLRIFSGPAQVTIPAGGSVTANYVVDSGIRVPVPQQ